MAIQKRMSKATGKTIGYQVIVDTRDANNKRQRHVIGTYKTKKEAERKEREALRHRDTGTFVVPSELTVAMQLEAWLSSMTDKITPNSMSDYRTIVRKHIIPALGTIPVQKLTTTRLQAQYATWREAGLSARMIRGCHMRLSQALKQAVQHGIIYANPCDSVSPPKLTRSKATVWNPEEAMRFLDQAQAMPVLTRGGDTGRTRLDDLHPLWHLLLLEGMRRGEALGLRWRDVDLTTGMASIVQTVAPDKNNRGRAMIQTHTKTKTSSRSVQLTGQTLDALREHRDRQAFVRKAAGDTWQDNDLIICTRFGTPVNPTNTTRNFNAIVEAAKLDRIRIHDLRHTSATMLLLAGVPAKVVSERLGHASVSITLDLYSHVLPSMQADAASAMDRLLTRRHETG